MSKTYVALIADASASRRLPPRGRAGLQAEARAALGEFNRRYRPVLAARFAVTLGDELQGLLTTTRAVWDITHHIRARLPAVDWVVAWGRGPTSTPRAATAPPPGGTCSEPARTAPDPAHRGRRAPPR